MDNTNQDDKLREFFIQFCVKDYSALESRRNEFAPAEMKKTIEGKVSWLRGEQLSADVLGCKPNILIQIIRNNVKIG